MFCNDEPMFGEVKHRARGDAGGVVGEPDLAELYEGHFIRIVRGYEELHDPAHPLHHDQDRKRSIWQEIGTIVNEPAEECRRKWGRMRAIYQRSLLGQPGHVFEHHHHKLEHQVISAQNKKLLSFLDPFITADQAGSASFQYHTLPAATTLMSGTPAADTVDQTARNTDSSLLKPMQRSDDSDSSTSDEEHGKQPQESIVDFFVNVGKTVKDFPESIRLHIKREAFRIVTDAEEMLCQQKMKESGTAE